jgi:hypothetical protein
MLPSGLSSSPSIAASLSLHSPSLNASRSAPADGPASSSWSSKTAAALKTHGRAPEELQGRSVGRQPKSHVPSTWRLATSAVALPSSYRVEVRASSPAMRCGRLLTRPEDRAARKQLAVHLPDRVSAAGECRQTRPNDHGTSSSCWSRLRRGGRTGAHRTAPAHDRPGKMKA